MGTDISETLSSPLDVLHIGIFLFKNLPLLIAKNTRRGR
jgi:hypothetical protein